MADESKEVEESTIHQARKSEQVKLFDHSLGPSITSVSACSLFGLLSLRALLMLYRALRGVVARVPRYPDRQVLLWIM